MSNKTTVNDFKNPHSLGNKIGRFIWGWCWLLLFLPTPKRIGNKWRIFLLRLFGATIGRSWIHPHVKIWAPWLLTVGNDCYIDAGVNLYDTYGIEIGNRVIISAQSVLCSVSHDYTSPAYALIGEKITIQDDVWITMQAFICPGILVGNGAIIGACSVVTRDVGPWSVVAGNPAREIKKRILREEG